MSEENKKSVNPYLDGRREWNERYGSYISQAKSWRMVAVISSTITILAVLGNIYIGSQSKIKPFIIAVDKVGTPISASQVPSMQINEKMVKYALADFITNLRTVYKSNPNIQKKMIHRAYSYLSNSLPAFAQISDYMQKDSPFQKTSDTQVNVISVLQLDKQQYQIDWTEKTPVQGGGFEEIKYRGTINYVTNEPKTESEIMKNPIGLFIKDISYQKTLN